MQVSPFIPTELLGHAAARALSKWVLPLEKLVVPGSDNLKLSGSWDPGIEGRQRGTVVMRPGCWWSPMLPSSTCELCAGTYKPFVLTVLPCRLNEILCQIQPHAWHTAGALKQLMLQWAAGTMQPQEVPGSSPWKMAVSQHVEKVPAYDGSTRWFSSFTKVQKWYAFSRNCIQFFNWMCWGDIG